MPTRLYRPAVVAVLFAAQLLVASCLGLAAEDPPPAAGKRPANRLAKETSPYLLLHAHNPVDWHPWGEEALAKARQEKKLIFLSVGYSSCYWCHVMERESFMDDEIAAYLNEHFVCIKVDREERPDIDEIYMQALHVYLRMIGSKQGGGWPLSMFLTPDGKPLMGGTYFPPREKDGRLGFLTVLERVQGAWQAEPEKWQKTGDSLAEYVADSLKQRPMIKVMKLDTSFLDATLNELESQYDATYGGFGYDEANPRQAKFPEPPNLFFLLDRVAAARSEVAAKMLNKTLEAVALGGIRDHVGGGFHRYSTDRYWRVPHFEKMLYDNAQLVTVYTQAFELAPRPEFERAVRETLDFVAREMTDPDGGFYAALDAETNSEEGRYYVWERGEVQQALAPEEYTLFASVYGLDGEPNFEGRYILLLDKPLADTAHTLKMTEQALAAQLQPLCRKLLEARNKRPRPLTDNKIITAWNGLMIRALADAGRVFKHPPYIAAATKAADFVLAKSRDSRGRLQRTYAAGQAKVLAYLDDYAFLTDGLLALARATDDSRWLTTAGELTDKQIALFWDERVGGFYFTSTAHETLIARSKLPTDGVIPSGNSVSAMNLVALGHLLRKPEYLERAKACIQSAGPIFEEHPSAVVQMNVALSRWLIASSGKQVQPARP